MTNGDLQNTTQKTKDGATQTTRKSGDEQRCPRKGKEVHSLPVAFVLLLSKRRWEIVNEERAIS
jgi:hypothetical protein